MDKCKKDAGLGRIVKKLSSKFRPSEIVGLPFDVIEGISFGGAFLCGLIGTYIAPLEPETYEETRRAEGTATLLALPFYGATVLGFSGIAITNYVKKSITKPIRVMEDYILGLKPPFNSYNS